MESKGRPADTAPDDAQKGRRLEMSISVACALFLAAHLVASYLPSARTWGFHQWLFFPSVFRAFLVAGMLLSFPAVSTRLISLIHPVVSGIFAGRRSRTNRLVVFLLISLAFFPVFWLLRSRAHFLGDGYILIRSLLSGNQFIAGEPIDSHIHYVLYRILHWSPETVYALISCIAGACFIFILLHLSDTMGKNAFEKSFFFLSMLSMGSIQLFFGYVESYSLLTLGLLLYVHISILFMKGKVSIFYPSAVLSLVLCTHLSAMIFVPSLLYLVLTGRKGAHFRTKPFRQYVAFAGGFVIPILFTIVVIYAAGFNLNYFREALTRGSHILPLTVKPTNPDGLRYGLLSLSHLVNMLNTLMLIAPIGVLLGIPFFSSSRRKTRRDMSSLFYSLLCVMSILYMVILKADKGASRDWDLFAVCGIPLTLYGTSRLLHASLDRQRFTRIAVLVCVAASLHAIPWVLVNADRDRSVERFKLLAENEATWSSVALADAYDELARYCRDTGDRENMLRCYEQAAEARPNVRYNVNLAAAHLESGLYEQALSEYEQIEKPIPANLVEAISYGMALAYYHLNRFEEAVPKFQEVINRNPDLLEAHLHLGDVYLQLRKPELAIAEYNEVLRVNPRHSGTHYGLALAYHNLGQQEKAIKELRAVIEIDPDHAPARDLLDRLVPSNP